MVGKPGLEGWCVALCLVLMACEGSSEGSGDPPDGDTPDGDDSGHWVTVQEPLAEFPQVGLYSQHVEFDGSLFILYSIDGFERLVRYSGGPFEAVADNDASYFGSHLTVHDGELFLSFIQPIGGGISRIGVARLGPSGFEVIEPNVATVALRDLPQGASDGTTIHWLFTERQEVGSAVGRYSIASFDGTSFDIQSFDPPDAAYSGTPHLVTEGQSIHVIVESSGLVSGDYSNPYKVYRLEAGALVEVFSSTATPAYIEGAPDFRDGHLYLTEGQGGLGTEVVRYGFDGERETLASDDGYVYGAVRASNLGPSWVKYYVGSVDNRYSRNQYFALDSAETTDLPFRSPDGVSAPGGTDAESFLFGISTLTAKVLLPFLYQGQVHMIANAQNGVGQAGNPSEVYLMRYDEN